MQEGGPQVADDAGAKDQDLGGRKSSFVQCLGQDLAVWRERLLVSVGRLNNVTNVTVLWAENPFLVKVKIGCFVVQN